MSRLKPTDTIFSSTIIAFVVAGLVIFLSASFAVLQKSEAQFVRMLVGQIVFGAVGGGILCYVASRLDYHFWRKYALFLAIGGLVATLLVFVPGLGFAHGGAQRWISLGFVTLQPSEIMRFGFILYFAAWLAWVGKKVSTWRFGLLPCAILIAVAGVVLLLQPDTDTLVILAVSLLAMLFVAGMPWKHVLAVVMIGILGAAVLVAMRPYLFSRFATFLNPARDPLGASYQVQQSLIAIGSGGFFGRGYGQSVQKFNYLPEPVGDSIFAVAGEELGFVGTTAIVVLYLILYVRGLYLSNRIKNPFGRYVLIGFLTLIVSQSLLNIMSMLGLFPLSGTPLIFLSHGGTSLAITLLEAGILLNISRSRLSEPVA